MSKELANDCLALDADIHTIEFNRLLLDDMHYSQVLKQHHVCDSAPVNTTYFLAAIAALYVYIPVIHLGSVLSVTVMDSEPFRS